MVPKKKKHPKKSKIKVSAREKVEERRWIRQTAHAMDRMPVSMNRIELAQKVEQLLAENFKLKMQINTLEKRASKPFRATTVREDRIISKLSRVTGIQPHGDNWEQMIDLMTLGDAKELLQLRIFKTTIASPETHKKISRKYADTKWQIQIEHEFDQLVKNADWHSKSYPQNFKAVD